MHRDSGSAHVRGGEAHQLAHGHVILAVPVIRVPALTVTDVSRTMPERSLGSISHCPPDGTVCWADSTGAAMSWRRPFVAPERLRAEINSFARRFPLSRTSPKPAVLAQLRLVKPTTEEDRRLVRSLQSRTVLVLKMLNRLYGHPPPDR